jgi:outer membrane lipoprotein carrier protein
MQSSWVDCHQLKNNFTMINIRLIIPFLFAVFSVNAQFDPQAINIIEPVSNAIIQSNGFKADFQFVIENKQEGIAETDKGTIWIKNNRYRLNVLGTETYFDGKTQWVHMIEEEEVNISTPDEGDGMELTPYNIFTMYKQGFRFKIVEEDATTATIEMFPDDKSQPYFKIRLVIDKVNTMFKEVSSFGRDGLNTTIKIGSYQKNVNLNDAEFVYHPEKHPNVEIIDLR